MQQFRAIWAIFGDPRELFSRNLLIVGRFGGKIHLYWWWFFHRAYLLLALFCWQLIIWSHCSWDWAQEGVNNQPDVRRWGPWGRTPPWSFRTGSLRPSARCRWSSCLRRETRPSRFRSNRDRKFRNPDSRSTGTGRRTRLPGQSCRHLGDNSSWRLDPFFCLIELKNYSWLFRMIGMMRLGQCTEEIIFKMF